MTEENMGKFDFLKAYIEKLLDDNGFAEMSEKTRGEYIPQFVAEAERRLGLATMKELDEAGAKELTEVISKEDLTGEELKEFWYKHIPDFDNLVKKTLEDFAVEFKQTLSGIS